jgi:hypothetical protein
MINITFYTINWALRFNIILEYNCIFDLNSDIQYN